MDEAADAVLVAAVLAGDLESYAILVRRHHGTVMRVATRMLSGRAACDELVQDVFVAAYEGLEDFDQQRALPAWLAGIARNQVLMRLRQQRRQHRMLDDYRQEALRSLSADEAADDASSERLHAALNRCQAALAPLAAEAVALHYRCGLELAEVAQRLGRSVVATRQLLYRIRNQLRLCLQQQGLERP